MAMGVGLAYFLAMFHPLVGEEADGQLSVNIVILLAYMVTVLKILLLPV